MFAVTTRNKLRSRRHAVSMIWAWAHIRRQLERTPGMLAYTTGIANLTEFFTLTLWEKEIDMTLFMASEDHRDMMWNARHWSESFWSMRWNPARDEVGTWSGRAFSKAEASATAGARYVGPGYLETSDVPESLRPYLRNITRQSEPNTLPVCAVIGRIPARSPLALSLVRRCLAAWRTHPDVLYCRVCVGLGECLLLVVWNNEAEREATALMAVLQSRFHGAWAMRFNATDFEIGHWDRRRFRDFGKEAKPGPAAR
jgi:hypothetical protein